jgi:quercetin dioxygenase-like cupin family protein
MRVIRVKPAVADRRGTITDVLDGTRVECVTLVTSKKGAVRGNHYHKKTTQYTYVLRGRFRLLTQRGKGRVQSRVVKAGDLVVTPPLERHTFVALEDSLLIACAHGPRAGRSYESDTYRLSVPLAAPSH